MSEQVKFAVTQADYTIQVRVTRETKDLLIEIIGGDVPHYGVVTTIQPDGNTQTINLPSRPGHVHQEGVLTRQMAKTVLPALTGNAIIVSGMHVNDINDKQMKAAVPMTVELGRKVKDWLDKNPPKEPQVVYAPSRRKR